jgi:hypothetical protein
VSQLNDQKEYTDDGPPRVTADFGGRRKIFERRLKGDRIDHPDRRRGRDRRSGFDRRSAENQEACDDSMKRDLTGG